MRNIAETARNHREQTAFVIPYAVYVFFSSIRAVRFVYWMSVLLNVIILFKIIVYPAHNRSIDNWKTT